MISKMWVLCLPRAVACAENVIRATNDASAAPNKTIPESRELKRARWGSIR
jgi:hypothetical protein